MKTFIFSLFSAFVTVAISSCNSTHEAVERPVSFQTTKPYRTDTIITKEYVGQVRSIQHIEIRALEKGYLQNIYVDEGQYVKQGELMFQITPMLYEAELHKAQAEVNFAEIEYLNTKLLADSNIVSPNELALAKAKYDKAKAELALSETHLNFTKITAPFSGIIDRFQVRLGSLLDEGELLTSLSDNSQLWVYFNVPEAEYLDYKSQISKENPLDVSLKMANGKMFDYTGRITTIEADFNSETGNIAFRATFPNPKQLLRHGETGNILINSTIKNALIIPQKATFEVLDKQYVYVLDKDNRIRARRIIIEEELPHIYIVKEGLRKVKEGDLIDPQYAEPASVISHLDLYAE